jgi:TIR domain
MGKIFISYRRDDAGEAAGRLSDNLVERFGRDSIFMDVDGIALGRDFRTVIEETLGQCGVMLAVMGKDWLQSKDAKGNRRLDQPTDFVRLEITSALKRDIPVIPVCVQGASVPSCDDLPDELKNFAFRNAFELTHARWSSDVQLLTERLRPYMEPVAQPQPNNPPPTHSYVPPAHVPPAQPPLVAPTVSLPAFKKKFSKKIVKWFLVGLLFLMLLKTFDSGADAALGGCFLFGLPAIFLIWDPAKWFVAKP